MPAPSDARLHSLLSKIAVLIPAWDPDERLVELVESLGKYPLGAILIVNDGSAPSHEKAFEKAASIRPAIVLRHERNCGQGRAVKTALAYITENMPGFIGAVTADADGQHAVDDIVRVALATAESSDRPVLGVRRFGARVPLRSRLGNQLTRHVFGFLSGYRISDTQSGLRGIPQKWFSEVLVVHGDRYEFATSVLAHYCRRGWPPLEVPIATIYLDRNRSSHFLPVRDSIRIYCLLICCYWERFAPPAIDFAMFILFFMMRKKILLAVMAGRAGAIVASMLVRALSKSSDGMRITRRLLCWLASGVISFAIIWILIERLNWNVLNAKIFAEAFICVVLISSGALNAD